MTLRMIGRKLISIVNTGLEYAIIGVIAYVIFFHFNWYMLFCGILSWAGVRIFTHLDKSYGTELGDSYNILFRVGVLISLIGGNIFDLYNHISYFDKILHLINPIGLTLITFKVYEQKLPKKIPLGSILTIAFFTVISAISIWECGEFGMDKLFEADMQGVYDDYGVELMSPIDDTMIDMLLGTIGSAVACVSISTIKTKGGTDEAEYNHHNKK